MERYEIEAFLALADELHFGRTAQRLRVSTAHISKTIKRLERRIGVPLFERTSRKVALTPIGEQLRADVRPGYEQIQRGVAAAIAAGRGISGTLRVGFVGAAAGEIIFRVAAASRRRYPDNEIQAREVQFDEALASLRADKIKVLLITLPIEEPDLVTGPVLFTEPRLLAVSATHPLARHETAALEDLATIPMVTGRGPMPGYWYDNYTPQHTPSGKPIPRGPSAATFGEVLALVAAGQCGATVGAQARRFYSRPDLTYLPLRDAEPFRWALVWKAADGTEQIRAFVRTARDTTAVVQP